MTERVKGLLALAVLAALLALLWQRTEWVEIETELPPIGAARDNPLYGVQVLAERLGARVELHQEFDHLPPDGATLLLTSPNWQLLPGRQEALRAWVERGGHLVLAGRRFRTVAGVPTGSDEPLDWLPVAVKFDQADGRLGVTPPDDIKIVPGAGVRAKPKCRTVREPERVPPAYAGQRDYTLCDIYGSWLDADVPPLWSVNIPPGPVALIVPVGAGSVGVYADHDLVDSKKLLNGDHARITAALLRAGPGRTIWLVPFERREPLPRWLWQRAWPSLLLAALAIALWLWRRARRFGPALPPLPVARRSLADQVRGTARFLWRHEPAALEAAQHQATAAAYAAAHRQAGAPALPPLPPRPNAASAANRKTLPTRLRVLESLRRQAEAMRHPNRSPRR